MGFTTVQALTTEYVTNGKYWETFFQKTTGATAYTAGRWYDLSMIAGTPRPNVYPGGLQDATKLWYKSAGAIYSGTPLRATMTNSTLAVASNLTLTDTVSRFISSGFTAGMTVIMSGWTNAGNNVAKTILTVTAGTITFTDTVGLVAELKGNNVSVNDTTIVTSASPTKHITRVNLYSNQSTVANSVMMLCDYLMFYPLFDMDSTDYQNTTQGTPVLTLPRYPTGEGVQMFMVTTSDIGATPNIGMQVSYTNSKGISGRLTNYKVNLMASAIPGQIAYSGSTYGISAGPFIPLQAGDTGVLTVDAVQLTGGTGAGWGCIVLCKPLLHMSIRSNVVTTEKCFVSDIPTVPKVSDEAFLSWLMFAGGAVAGGSLIGGDITFGWGSS